MPLPSPNFFCQQPDSPQASKDFSEVVCGSKSLAWIVFCIVSPLEFKVKTYMILFLIFIIIIIFSPLLANMTVIWYDDLGLPWWLREEKNPPAIQEPQETQFWFLGQKCSMEEKAWQPTPRSYLENPMDRGAWWATVQGVAKSQTRLKWLSTHKMTLSKFDLKEDSSIYRYKINIIYSQLMMVTTANLYLLRIYHMLSDLDIFCHFLSQILFHYFEKRKVGLEMIRKLVQNYVAGMWHSRNLKTGSLKPGHSISHLQFIIVVQSLSCVQLFGTPWTAARQASLSFTVSRVCSNSSPLSQWCHATISSSVAHFPLGLSLSQHQDFFQWVKFSHQVAKVLELQHQSFQRIFRTDFL